MFISTAYAQTGGAPADAFGLMSLLPFLGIFVVFYFLLIRPQQKKQKEHKNMIASVRRGDRVVTGGGIFGTVTKVINEQEIQVEIAEGVRVKVLKGTLVDIPSRTGPVSSAGAKTADKRENEDTDEDDAEDKEVVESTESAKR